MSVTIGVVATAVVALAVVAILLLTGGAKALSDNAALIGALVALGGVFTTQLVSIALGSHRVGRRPYGSGPLEGGRAFEGVARVDHSLCTMPGCPTASSAESTDEALENTHRESYDVISDMGRAEEHGYAARAGYDLLDKLHG